MAYTQLIPHHTPGARVEEISRDATHYRLSIPSGPSGSYRLAQLDDYAKTPRRLYPNRPPLTISLLARASSDSIPGTWGFGFWNHPFGLSLGFGGNSFSPPALPNAVWFFGASEENYLSFGGRVGETVSRPPANGFIAQTFRSPRFHPLLILAGLALPFSHKMTRRLLSHVIEENGIQLWNPSSRHMHDQTPAGQRQSQSVDPAQWHRYRLDWREKRVAFEVEDVLVFESVVSPNPPLGLVIWIDNQFAAFTPEGKIGFGVLANPEPAWLEVKEIELKSL